MLEQTVLSHHIQKHIVRTLLYKKYARFSELRPPKTDTNLYSYHLKALLKEDFIKKQEGQYSLSMRGLAYVDRISSESVAIRRQPKIISMLLVQNSDGEVLLQKRIKQPYIDAWTLPYGKVHIDDATTEIAAKREAFEKLSVNNPTLAHVGDCYIRVYTGGAILSSTLAHVFRFTADDIEVGNDTKWVDPLKLSNLPLAPAVEEIVSRCFFGDTYFFAEFDCQWDDIG